MKKKPDWETHLVVTNETQAQVFSSVAMPKKGQIIPSVKTDGRITLQFTPIHLGHDLCIVICGGDQPHLGAAAVAECHPNLTTSLEMSTPVSVLTLPGHKEDHLASWVAARISRSCGANVVVLCGIHVDNISKTEIETIHRLIDKWCDEYIAAIC
ncbi:MAG: hypothetical protein H6Q72_1214 [Firmicutes bacterium]|nr:hypothetical protein [Bacillota bacterium]